MRRSLVGATAALLLGVVALLGTSSFAAPGAVAAYGYDPAATPAAQSYLAGVTPAELGEQAPSQRTAPPTHRYDDRDNLAPASARLGAYRLAPQTTLYRAVPGAEADDIARHGFRQAPSGRSYEGKLFATSADDAARYGRINYGIDGKPFHIVEARVPTSFVRSLYSDTADSMRYVAVDPGHQLAQLNRLARVNIWDHVPWVAKP